MLGVLVKTLPNIAHMGKKLISSEEAVPAKGQHSKPCSDCPLRKDALHGWLGDASPTEWVSMLHGETRIDCHVLEGAQCAGAAIYRANVAKRPRNKLLLLLPKDEAAVFESAQQFLEHHEKRTTDKED